MAEVGKKKTGMKKPLLAASKRYNAVMREYKSVLVEGSG